MLDRLSFAYREERKIDRQIKKVYKEEKKIDQYSEKLEKGQSAGHKSKSKKDNKTKDSSNTSMSSIKPKPELRK